VEAVNHPRVRALIDRLGLARHPEGGYYAQTFRSESIVVPADGRGERAALTTIYFLLVEGERSRWHRVRSDEVWHFYEGAPLELLELTPALDVMRSQHLGPLEGSQTPVHVIPAGHWQAARSTGSYTLVGCTVGPGFEFDDFLMMADAGPTSAKVLATFPEAASWI
jgi:predicted cupin superfamily sugar epimerase